MIRDTQYNKGYTIRFAAILPSLVVGLIHGKDTTIDFNHA